MSDAHVVQPPTEDESYSGDLPVLGSVAQIVRLSQTAGALFLGLAAEDGGAGPRDPESGYRLPGTPCYALVPEPWWLDSTATWVARQLTSRAHLVAEGLQPRLLVGAIVGRGADGQPLVAPAHPLGVVDQAAFVEAESVYASWRCRVL